MVADSFSCVAKAFGPVSSVALICKQNNADVLTAAATVEAWLVERGVKVITWVHEPGNPRNEDMLGAEIALVLGGDGTIVSVARQMLGTGKPIAGINFGKVGFLAELGVSSWRRGLEKILAGKIRVEERMSLCYRLERNGTTVHQGEVVNDVVVTRGKVARLARLELAFDGKDFVSLRSDGLIISTPTGSTGYACSAGGPLLHPGLSAFVVAAICPFLSNFPPLVQNACTHLAVTIGDSDPDIHLTLDGQLGFPLQTGDTLHVHGEQGRLVFAELGMVPYFERLRRSGFVMGNRNPV